MPFWPCPLLLEKRFAIWPEAVRATHELAERLEFIPRPRIIMPPWETGRAGTRTVVLREMAYRGAGGRYGRNLSPRVVEPVGTRTGHH